MTFTKFIERYAGNDPIVIAFRAGYEPKRGRVSAYALEERGYANVGHVWAAYRDARRQAEGVAA
jgi:hypothetical protein